MGERVRTAKWTSLTHIKRQITDGEKKPRYLSGMSRRRKNERVAGGGYYIPMLENTKSTYYYWGYLQKKKNAPRVSQRPKGLFRRKCLKNLDPWSRGPHSLLTPLVLRC